MGTEKARGTKTTLVLGNTGKTGRRVVGRLVARGLSTRVGSRSGEPPFDWEDEATWAPALQDVESVYISYFPDLAVQGAVAAVRTFADLAVEAGVGRLLLSSGRGEEEVIGATRSEEIELGDLPPEIYENWARSHEEDTERVEVYRPRDFAFPPSFPRPGFEIEENGEFQEYVPAPNDAGVVPGRAGCWKAVGGNIIRVRFDDPEAEPYTLRIASVEEGVLRIRR
ncbi:MAG: SDR family oxidoreductase [Actinomycetota bacterium]|jgi:hypothetical protein|nr:SDR family oxidoreductase [Actinomycetota bacterium]